jgi:hypothetical protein
MITHQALFSAFAIVVTAGCTTPGTNPDDMSAKAHVAAAKREEAAAEQHVQDGSAVGVMPAGPCRAGIGRGAANEGACWTAVAASTYPDGALEHRRHAAEHRAASVALMKAEATACVGLSDDDRDVSPFEHVQDIESVAPLLEREERAGAVVVFHAVPGLTAAWFQRVVDCHLARSAAVGHVMPEMPNCPLVPTGAEAKVTSVGSGFAVAIRADDRASADEIFARAQRLLPVAMRP